MPNRFEQPLAAQFIDTYVPIPFQEMMAAGQMKQDKYDKAAAATDAMIGALDEIQAIPFSEDERRAKEYSNRMRLIRDKYITKDLSDPFVQRELSNEINSSINKEDIKHIQQSYQGYVGYNKLLSQYELEGRPAPDWSRKIFEGYDSSVNGVFTGNPEKKLDVYGETSQFFKNMDMTVKDKNVPIAPGVGAIRYAKEKEDIVDHARRNIEAFMDLPAVNQYVRGMRAQKLDTTSDGKRRTDEELALDYVENNWRQWTGERYDTYAIPEWAGKGGTGGIQTGLPEPELHVPKGVSEEESESVSVRKTKKEIEEIRKAYEEDPDNKYLESQLDQIKAVQEGAINTPQEGSKITPTQKIEIIRKRGDDNFRAAFEALVEKGMTNDAAFQYLTSNSPKGLFVGTEDNPLMRGRVENFVDKLGTAAAKTLIKTSPLLTGFNPEESKSYREALEYYKNNTLTKEQVLANYIRESNSAQKDLNKELRNVEKIKSEAYNKLKVNQDTYTVMNGMYEYSNGSIQGVIYDENQNRKTYQSPLGKSVGNVIYNMNDYSTNFYDETGKELKGKKDKLYELVKSSKGFMITGIDDKPTEDNSAMVTVHMLNQDNAPTGDKFKVKIPFRSPKEFYQAVNELYVRNQEGTAWQFIKYNDVKNAVDSTSIYRGGKILLSDLGVGDVTDNDFISFEPSGGGVIPIIHYEGEVKPMSEYPVILNNVAQLITSYLHKVKEDIK